MARIGDQVNVKISYQDFLNSFADFDFDLSFWDEAEYQGLDVEQLFKTILKSASDAGWDFKTLLKNLMTCMIWFARRSANIERGDAQSRSIATGWNKISDIVQKLKIKGRVGNATSSNTVTLPRIAAVFPELLLPLYNIGLAKPIYQHPELPAMLCVPQAPSILTQDEWAAYKDKHIDAMVEMSKIINRKNPDPLSNLPPQAREEARKKNQEVFAENAFSSSFARQNLARRRAAFLIIQDTLDKDATRQNKSRDASRAAFKMTPLK